MLSDIKKVHLRVRKCNPGVFFCEHVRCFCMSSTSTPNKFREIDIKLRVAQWFEEQGVQYCFQEFEYIRRPDLIAFNFDDDSPSFLFRVFLRVPFDYIASKYTRKTFQFDDLARKFNMNSAGLKRDLNVLVLYGYLARSEKGYRVIKTSPILDRMVTVECKVSDWRQGLEQAVSYKMLFSRESYVALPKKYLKNVRIQDFKKYGIGLLCVDVDGSVSLELKPSGKVKSYYTHSAAASIAKSFHSDSLKKLFPCY